MGCPEQSGRDGNHACGVHRACSSRSVYRYGPDASLRAANERWSGGSIGRDARGGARFDQSEVRYKDKGTR